MSTMISTVPNTSTSENPGTQPPTSFVAPLSTPPQITMPGWLAIINVGTLVTVLIAVIGFAYYLGGLNSSVTVTSQNVEKLNTSVNGTSRDSVASRLSAIESKLDGSVANRLSAIETKLDATNEKLSGRLDAISEKLSARK